MISRVKAAFGAFFLSGLVCFPFASAYAVTITNLDAMAHRVVIEYMPGSEEVYEIAPGNTVRGVGNNGRLYLEGQAQDAQFFSYRDHYAIWPKVGLHIQKRRDSGKRL